MQYSKQSYATFVFLLMIALAAMTLPPALSAEEAVGPCRVFQAEQVPTGLICQDYGCFITPCCYDGDCDVREG